MKLYSSKCLKLSKLSTIYKKYYGINTIGLPYNDNTFKFEIFLQASTEYSKSHN